MMAELEKDAPNEHLTSNIIPESFTENEHDPFDEPHATLPLWRRFDTHFWWNEQLTSEFADAGVSSFHNSLRFTLLKNSLAPLLHYTHHAGLLPICFLHDIGE